MERDCNKYILKDGNRTVYIGTTDDLERREKEHRNDGMEFTSIQKVGNLTTKDAAGNWEEETINKYQKQHGGNLPKYNKNTSGK